MSDNSNSNILDTLWNHKVYGKLTQFFLGAGLTYLIMKMFPTEGAYIKALISLNFGILTIFFIETQKVRETNESLKNEILGDVEILKHSIELSNSESNKHLKEFITEKVSNELENKIYRKLVSTNAIIPNRNNKVSITAKILDKFADESDYKDIKFEKNTTESVDLIRLFAYQNLILTPKYLEYFFYRRESVNKASRIIVVSKDQIDEGICQATLTFIFMSYRIGYETYIISDDKYRQIVNGEIYSDDLKKAIKGNPSMLKIKKNETEFEHKGDFSDFKENIEIGKTTDIEGIRYWDTLNLFIRNSAKINPISSTGFDEFVKTKFQNLSKIGIAK